MENTNKRKYTMFNIMTDRWLKRRLRSPWRSTKTMGEKKRPQPGTNHGQMLLVCSVREWRQTGLAPQHTARTRTHTPGNNITRRTARQARARGNAQHGRVALAVLPQPTTADWNRTDADDDSRDWRATDGRTDRVPTNRLLLLLLFRMFRKLLFRTDVRLGWVYTLYAPSSTVTTTSTTTDRRRKLRHGCYICLTMTIKPKHITFNFKLYYQFPDFRDVVHRIEYQDIMIVPEKTLWRVIML